MKVLQSIYDNSPIFFQNIMTSVAGYMKNENRFGKIYYEYRDFYKEFDQYSLEEQLEYQRKELIKFINFTYNHSFFYQELYKNIDINSINDISDLKNLPIVDKEMLRSNINQVVTIPKKGAVIKKTGGTTGKSLIVRSTPEDTMKRVALLDHFKSRVGFENLKMKKATFNGQHIIPPNQKENIFWRYNAPTKQMIYSSFHLTEENLRYYVESLNKFKPDAIDGFFSSMLDVASYIERHNLKVEFQPVAIFPTSETLTESGRELLEKVFNCKVYDQYASSEGAPFVTECKNQKLHIELSSGVFENYEENNNEILVTSFNTQGTPLIRYRIGDSIIFNENKEPCGCGLTSPVVKEIIGRKQDFLYTSEGAKINSGNISNIFKNIPSAIIRAQLIQDRIGELKVLLEVDKSTYKDKYDLNLKDEIRYKFGKDTIVTIVHVEQIPREKSGKYKMVKNNIEM